MAERDGTSERVDLVRVRVKVRVRVMARDGVRVRVRARARVRARVRASERVDLVHGDAQLAHAIDGLRGEGFVDLEDVDLREQEIHTGLGGERTVP